MKFTVQISIQSIVHMCVDMMCHHQPRSAPDAPTNSIMLLRCYLASILCGDSVHATKGQVGVTAASNNAYAPTQASR